MPVARRQGDTTETPDILDEATLSGFQLRPGARVGPCVLIRPLGRGGMGEVWLARNALQERDEAVKVLRATGSDLRERKRFVGEAKAAMAVGDAPEIVKTFDVGECGGRLYIRMEHVRGASLNHIPPPAGGELVQLFKKMAAALAIGHRRGIIHRDIKPSNFMLADDGVVKLMDFGLARAAGGAGLTMTQDQLGTPAFMSLEQWESPKSVDARADVFSLGVSFYTLATGRLPFEVPPDAPQQAYLAKLLTEDPAPLVLPAGAPPQLENLILKAMAKRAPERFADAAEVLTALARIEKDPGSTVEAPLSEAKRRRRSRISQAVIACGSLLGVAGIMVAGIQAYIASGSLSDVDDAIRKSLDLVTEIERAPLKDDFDAKLQLVAAAEKAFGEAASLAGKARDRGAAASELSLRDAEIAAGREFAKGLGLGLEALRTGKLAEAVTALEPVAKVRGGSAPLLLRARRAKASRDALDEAIAHENAGETEKALECARRAPGGALQGWRVEATIARLEERLEREAKERIRSEASRRARELLAEALAAEPRGPDGREPALKAYIALVTCLDELEEDLRAPIEGALGLTALEARNRAERLKLESRVDAALALVAKDPARAEEALKELFELDGSLAGDDARSVDARKIRDQTEATVRATLVEQRRAAAEAALERGDAALALRLLVRALELGPKDGWRLFDLALYAGARASGLPSGRVLIRPVVVTVEGRSEYVPPFAIDRCEVTNEEFAAFVRERGYDEGPWWGGDVPAELRLSFLSGDGRSPGPTTWKTGVCEPERARHPVSGISFFEARAFARRRGGRLPSALERTVAAGYDPATKRLRTFPWGDEEDESRARLFGSETVPVDLPTADKSALDVLGLAGNVCEWIEDEKDELAGGSAWSRGLAEAQASRPRRWTRTRRDASSVGFRCAYTLPVPEELRDFSKGRGEGE